MTGINITLELDDAAARAALQELVRRLDDRKPFYRNVGEILQHASKQRFATETDPDGRAWARLRPATIRGRLRRGKSAEGILRVTSSLAAIRTELGDDEVRVGSPVRYAAIHQLGGTIRRTAREGSIFRSLERDGSTGRRFVSERRKRKVETKVAIPAYSITIPARPFLGAGPAEMAAIADEALTWLSDLPGHRESGA